jgi:hypothetical protein
MKKILFLDFDGVLHGEQEAGAEFCRLPILERYLSQMPDVEIVVSSSWRESRSLEELKALFPDVLRDRIIGVTPVHERGFDQAGRQREIEAYLESAALHHNEVKWIALDDHAYFFDSRCNNLVLVDPNYGFGDAEGRALLVWYASVSS